MTRWIPLHARPSGDDSLEVYARVSTPHIDGDGVWTDAQIVGELARLFGGQPVLKTRGEGCGAVAEVARCHVGYVITLGNYVLVRGPYKTASWAPYSWALYDDDQTWPEGHGHADWEAVADDDPRISAEDHARLDWLLDKLRAQEDPK